MTEPKHRICVASIEDSLTDKICAELRETGWGVAAFDQVPDAIDAIHSQSFACVVVRDTDKSSFVRDIFATLDVNYPSPVVALVKPKDVDAAVDAMKLGASAVIEFSEDRLPALIAAINETVPTGAGPIKDGDPRNVILRAPDSSLNPILDMLPQIALAQAPVLITGESGTGKELFARTIHNMSNRSEKPFIAVNCGAIPETLLESELFGYAKGAFTGAHSDKMGLFKAADGGTIFLDEIGEMPLRLQVKILRVLQEHQVTPIGTTKSESIDFRVITATNRNLEDEIAAQTFREDLFYRIAVLPLHLPPLRERPTDVAVLADAFLEEQNRVNSTRLLGITKETYSHLKRYDWPGNIRELENLMQRVCILKRMGYIELDDLPAQFTGQDKRPQQLGLYVPSEGMDMAGTLEKLETQLLEQALKKAAGNKAQAARLLGLNRTTLVEKVKRLQINLDDDK